MAVERRLRAGPRQREPGAGGARETPKTGLWAALALALLSARAHAAVRPAELLAAAAAQVRGLPASHERVELQLRVALAHALAGETRSAWEIIDEALRSVDDIYRGDAYKGYRPQFRVSHILVPFSTGLGKENRDEARKAVDQAIRLAEEAGLSGGPVSNEISRALASLGYYREAFRFGCPSLSYWRDCDPILGEALEHAAAKEWRRAEEVAVSIATPSVRDRAFQELATWQAVAGEPSRATDVTLRIEDRFARAIAQRSVARESARLGEFTVALGIARGISTKSERVSAQLDVAFAQLQAGQIGQALSTAETLSQEALQLAARVYRAASHALLRAGSLAEADKASARAVRLAELWVSTADHASVIPAASHGPETVSEYELALCDLAELQALAGDPEAAAATAGRLSARWSDSAMQESGLALAERGDFARALAFAEQLCPDFEKAVQQAKEDGDYSSLLANPAFDPNCEDDHDDIVGKVARELSRQGLIREAEDAAARFRRAWGNAREEALAEIAFAKAKAGDPVGATESLRRAEEGHSVTRPERFGRVAAILVEQGMAERLDGLMAGLRPLEKAHALASAAEALGTKVEKRR